MSYLIGQHIEHMQAAGLAATTIKTRALVLRMLHDALSAGLAWASTEEIERWLGNPKWSQWTRCTYAMHVRGFYRWAAKSAILDGDPAVEAGRSRQPRCVPHPATDEQLAAALDRLDDPWHTAVMLAAYAGLRCCEIVAVRRDDLTEDTLRVTRGKGGDAGVVPTHPSLWGHLAGRRSGLLVIGRRGAAFSANRLSAEAREHLLGIGLDLTMHQFRHWYGTSLLRNGADLRTVQELMRHSSIKSTEGYTRVVSEQRRLAIRTLPALTTPQQGAA